MNEGHGRGHGHGHSRRRFERVPLRVKVIVTVGQDLYQKRIPIECRDISGGGLSFETGTEVPVEAESRIVLGKLSNMPPDARIKARVAYSERNEDGRYTVGVEFVEFENTTRQELIDRIHSAEGAGA